MKSNNKLFFEDKYLYQLNQIKEVICKKTNEYSYLKNGSLGHYFYSLGLRTPLFYLESLARIDRKIGKDEELFEKLLLIFKKLEDCIGQYDFWYAYLNQAKKLKFKKEVIQYFEENTFMALGAMEHILKAEGLVVQNDNKGYDSPLTDSIIAEIKNAKREKCDEKENQKLLVFLRDSTAKAETLIKTGEINLDHLEEGIHEVRRRMRWFPIYRISLLGRIQFSKVKEGKPLSKYVTKQELENPFNKQVDCPEGIAPITIHTGAYMAMSVLIRDIGELKDNALLTELMEHTYQKLGLPASEIEAAIAPNYMSIEDVIKKSKEIIIKFVEDEKILSYLADHFDKQIK